MPMSSERPDVEKLMEYARKAAEVGGETMFDSQEVLEVCAYALALENVLKLHGIIQSGGRATRATRQGDGVVFIDMSELGIDYPPDS